MNDHKFGSLPAEKTIDCHKSEIYPTEDAAKKILKEIAEDLSGKIDVIKS